MLTYSNLFVAGCALLMTWETQYVFFSPNPQLLAFVFSATLATYFFHGLVNTVHTPESRQHVWNQRNKALIIALFILASVSTAYVGWPYRKEPLPFIIVAIGAFLYSAPNIPGKPFQFLQKIAVAKTVYLAMVWTIVTTILPMWVSHLVIPESYWWFLGYRFFLLLAICILFDLRDHQHDALKGIRSMPTMAQADTVRWIYHASLLLAGVFALGIQTNIINPWLVPVLILATQYKVAAQPRHEAYYTLFLDGMMAFTGFIALARALLNLA